ncbi:WD repeat-containing protein 6-like isoform X2 [Xenia sp. Carnegie-2017]|uniref:WD repeat-containing protein 6-like isoform X2 n=1 Tax=Xenia sp. Carnegie-2017 TaxID=2897299 RepID=UPI001F03FBED|nr:WD repeat-containing protein 6-like isoform X2 [Xenia sp. Carnegie-2017]
MSCTERNLSLVDREVLNPVTSLEIDSTGHLFVGEGPYLKIYEITDGRCIGKERLFEHQRIHSLKLCDCNIGTLVIACGGRTVGAFNVHVAETKSIFKKILPINEVTFNDWIWDACLLSGENNDDKCQSALVVTAHNAVWLWNIAENSSRKIAQCEENCILYCARFILQTTDLVWVACGTVFNELLLWKLSISCSFEKQAVVQKRIAGHDGVIFSVRYSIERSLLCSVSDDRSIKVRKVVFSSDFADVQVFPTLLTLYGHKARVWDCLILKEHIVSIGEDSLCLLWNSNGEIVRSWKGHIGKGVWSLASNADESIIATGGGDGGIRLWPVKDEVEQESEQQHWSSSIPSEYEAGTLASKENPRMIGMLLDTSVLVLTDTGNLYKFTQNEDAAHKVMCYCIRQEPTYSSYSLMVVSPCKTIAVLGNIKGFMKFVCLTDQSWHSLEKRPYENKILSLQCTNTSTPNAFSLFSCGPDGLIIWWIIARVHDSKQFVCEQKATFSLPYCRQRWLNTVLVVNNTPSKGLETSLVLCGDRRGSLHVYNVSASMDEVLQPQKSFVGIHGANGVTSIVYHSTGLYTTGRDGYLRRYKLHSNEGMIEMIDKRKVYKGVNWIDRIIFLTNGDILAVVFQSVDFIVWNITREEVMFRLPCGGGHRNWDIQFNLMNGSFVFTFLKQSTVNVCRWSRKMKQPSSIIQKCFHGRETNTVDVIGSIQNNYNDEFHVLVTGSEDTTLNIMLYKTGEYQKERLFKVLTCEGHVSSVRCCSCIKIKCLREDKDFPKVLIFSAGSRASLKCWLLDINDLCDSNAALEKDMEKEKNSLKWSCCLVGELKSSRYKRHKKKGFNSCSNEDFISDMRFMAITTFLISDVCASLLSNVDDSSYYVIGVVTACSDGYLRCYVFDSESKSFTMVEKISWNGKCILCVGHFSVKSSKKSFLLVYASDTAGNVTFWDVTEIFSPYVKASSDDVRTSSELQEIIQHDGEDVFVNGPSSSVLDDFQKDNSVSDMKSFSEEKRAFKVIHQVKEHQSGVNALMISKKGIYEYLMCSGGDDGAVVFACFKVETTNEILKFSSWGSISFPGAHTSAVTGFKILDNNLAITVSGDQRMKMWKVGEKTQNGKLCNVELLQCYWLDVVDVKGLDVLQDRNGLYYVVACGVGLELFVFGLS